MANGIGALRSVCTLIAIAGPSFLDNNHLYYYKHIIDHISPKDFNYLASMFSPGARIVLSIKPQILSFESLVHEVMRRERHVDLLLHDAHTKGSEHRPDMPGSFIAAVAAIRDNHSRFAFPFVEEEVDSVFELSWDAPVALGGQEDEGIKAGDATSPYAGVFMLVVLGRLDSIWDARFIEDGEIVVFEIDQVDGRPGS